MSFNKSDISRNACQLFGAQAHRGYDWWWHSLTARHAQTGEQRPFYFECFLCNPALDGQGPTDAQGKTIPVLGQLPANKAASRKPSYVMINCGTWGPQKTQLHRFFPWSEAKVAFGTPYSVEAADCYFTENEMHGTVSVTEQEAKEHPEWLCSSGSISWNLKIHKRVAFNVGYGASAPMRRWQLFEMFWHAEGMKTDYEGDIIYNGERYIVTPETCFGYADKNWGKDFTSPWVWLSSCNLTSEITGKHLEDSVFDIGGGCPKIGPVALPRQLLSAFWYEGKEFEFNFSKFWTGCRTKFDCHETDTEIVWHVDQRTWSSRMITDIRCRKEDMLHIKYEAPDGAFRHRRLWNGGNGSGTIEIYHHSKLLDRIHATNVGCEYGEYTD